MTPKTNYKICFKFLINLQLFILFGFQNNTNFEFKTESVMFSVIFLDGFYSEELEKICIICRLKRE